MPDQNNKLLISFPSTRANHVVLQKTQINIDLAHRKKLCGISDSTDVLVGKLCRVTGCWFSLEIHCFENKGGSNISNILSLSLIPFHITAIQ